MGIDFFLQLTINGLLLGAFYATMTLGFSTIWGVMRVINLAHGEFLLMGAFVAWFFFNPTREQGLIVEAIPGTVETVFIIAVVALGWLLGDALLRPLWPQRSAQQRRVGGVVVAALIGAALYFLWRGQEFQPFQISIMALVMIGLALSLGFIASHFLLRHRVPKQGQRRLLGYGLAALFTAVLYILWQSGGFQPIDPFISLVFIFPIFFALGYVLQKVLLNRIVEGPYLTMLLVTFSISIILQNIGLQIYRADPRRINVEYGTALAIGENLTVPPVKMLVVGVSVLMIIGLVVFLTRTRTGYAIRAAAQNKMAARLMGINIYETYAITFGLSIALTAIAGAMMGTFQPITPVNGPPWTLRAFSIVALGGLGKVQGVVLGGLLLGLVESFIGGYVGVGWAIAAVFIILVLVLIIRPQGLTGGLMPVEE